MDLRPCPACRTEPDRGRAFHIGLNPGRYRDWLRCALNYDPRSFAYHIDTYQCAYEAVYHNFLTICSVALAMPHSLYCHFFDTAIETRAPPQPGTQRPRAGDVIVHDERRNGTPRSIAIVLYDNMGNIRNLPAYFAIVGRVREGEVRAACDALKWREDCVECGGQRALELAEFRLANC